MTVNERIKYLRKEVLNLNQREFALSLGMAQTGISSIERDGATITDRVVKAICMAHNINEEWLRYGTGSMYIEPPAFSLDAFIKENQIDELESDIIRAYFEIAPEIRKEALAQFKAAMGIQQRSPWDEAPDTPEELEKLYPPVCRSDSDVG